MQLLASCVSPNAILDNSSGTTNGHLSVRVYSPYIYVEKKEKGRAAAELGKERPLARKEIGGSRVVRGNQTTRIFLNVGVCLAGAYAYSVFRLGGEAEHRCQHFPIKQRQCQRELANDQLVSLVRGGDMPPWRLWLWTLESPVHSTTFSTRFSVSDIVSVSRTTQSSVATRS